MVNVHALVIVLLLASSTQAATWTPQSVAAFGPDFVARNVFFTDADHGWIVGADNGPTLFSDHTPKIWATTDGGTNWTQQASGSDGDVMGVHFINNQVGWTSGRDNDAQSTRWTTDGGATWNLVSHGGSNFLMDVSAADASNVWAVGDTNVVRHSADGGQSWADQALPGLTGSPQAWNVEMISPTLGYVASVEGQIFKTTDGDAWSEVHSSLGSTYAMQFLDAQTGFIGGNDFFARTIDGGSTWTIAGLPDLGEPFTAAIGNNGLHFIDSMEGWALVLSGATPAIYHTTNAGDSWNLQYQFENDIFAGAITFSDPNTGWAVGENALPPALMSAFGPSLMALSLESSSASFLLQFDPNAEFVPGNLTPEPSSFVLLSLGLLLYRKRKHAPPGA